METHVALEVVIHAVYKIYMTNEIMWGLPFEGLQEFVVAE